MMSNLRKTIIFKILIGGALLYTLLGVVKQSYFDEVTEILEHLKEQQNIDASKEVKKLDKLKPLPPGVKDLKELRYAGDFAQIEPEDCIDTPEFYGGVKAKVCILPGEDYSQTKLKKEGAFEAEAVNSIVKAMTVYKDATFLDCGANIGMMSTVVAAMGRQVVSLDPLVEHLTYIRRSLELLGNENKARLLNNAVSNETGTLYPYTVDPANKAAIQLFPEEYIKEHNLTPAGPAVKVVTVMDILATIDTPTVILKVDVESWECRVVSTEVAHGESGHFIPFIIMEWTMLPGMPEYAECVGWLIDGGYKPYHMVRYTEFTMEEVLAIPNANHHHFDTGDNEYHDIIWLHYLADPVQLKP
eukprot:GFUD01069007.1.p1 GENE.GFUD01069007.1~~GFUD01069007.1.p1  ORF type:complete len:358 (-),score=107.51 GFUD01069007.1:27-1100(-)